MLTLKICTTVYINPFSQTEQPIGNPKVKFQKHLLCLKIVVRKFIDT
jgi:hypothetical protein